MYGRRRLKYGNMVCWDDMLWILFNYMISEFKSSFYFVHGLLCFILKYIYIYKGEKLTFFAISSISPPSKCKLARVDQLITQEYGTPKRTLMLIFWHQKIIFWYQKIIFDIRKSISNVKNHFLISENNLWYKKVTIFWYQKLTSDIRNYFLISENAIIFCYQKSKIIFWYQKNIFWYQKMSRFTDIRN